MTPYSVPPYAGLTGGAASIFADFPENGEQNSRERRSNSNRSSSNHDGQFDEREATARLRLGEMGESNILFWTKETGSDHASLQKCGHLPKAAVSESPGSVIP